MVQLSKSGMKETPELKAGHPPAVKAGGKRVVKKSYEESHAAPHVNPEREHKVPKSRYSTLSSLALTVQCWGHDFPETPVSVKHSRLRPAMEKPHSPAFKSSFSIQQPKKF
uniref:Uncharacterized protein n=1 Tax=Esox lucius TaxID=8010 RepID=A0A6Q2WQG4_ESOLU